MEESILWISKIPPKLPYIINDKNKTKTLANFKTDTLSTVHVQQEKTKYDKRSLTFSNILMRSPQDLCTSHSYVSNVVLLSPFLPESQLKNALFCLKQVCTCAQMHPRCRVRSHCESQTITTTVCPPAHCLAPWPEHRSSPAQESCLFKSPGIGMVLDRPGLFFFFLF